MLAVAGLVAGVGTADAGETATTREAGFELRLTPDGAGCRGIWWIVVDDLPELPAWMSPSAGQRRGAPLRVVALTRPPGPGGGAQAPGATNRTRPA